MHPRDQGDLELGRMIGSTIQGARLTIGWSQRELATRLKSSPSAIQRLEAGRSRYLDPHLVSTAFAVLGIRASFDAGSLGLAKRHEQADLVHAGCLAYASRRLEAAGWDVRVEVEIGAGRYRGWIDLLAFRALDRVLFCCELKTEIDDVGRIQRIVSWYGREAWAAAHHLGWRPRSTTTALLVLCSTDNDRAVRLNRQLLVRTFPTKARELAEWVASPGLAAPRSGLGMIDPRSRRSVWLRPTSSDGRSSPAPYADYAAAATAMLGRRYAFAGPRR